MKTIKVLILLLLFTPAFTFAGEIYGYLKLQDGSACSKREIKIKQGDKVFGVVTTDGDGYFSITIKEPGQFKLEIIQDTKAVTFDVSSNSASTSYNLTLKNENGSWVLKRT